MKDLKRLIHTLYQNRNDLDKFNNSTNIAINRGQTDIINTQALSGRLKVSTPFDVQNSTKIIDSIVSQAKIAATNAQLGKINNSRSFSLTPSQNSTNIANTVANTIMKNEFSDDMSIVLVPGNEMVPLQPRNKKSAIINTTNTILTGGANTLYTRPTNNKATIGVDANLAIVPTKHIINDDNIKIPIPNKTDNIAINNKLTEFIKNAQKSYGDIKNLTQTAQKSYSDISNKSQQITNNLINFL